MSKRSTAAKLSLGVAVDATMEGLGFEFPLHALVVWFPAAVFGAGFVLLFIDNWRLVGVGILLGWVLLVLAAIVFVLLGGAGGAVLM